MKDNQEIAKNYTDWHIKTGGYARDMTLRDHFAAEAIQELIPECFDFEETEISVKSGVPANVVAKLKETLSSEYTVKIGENLPDTSSYDIVVTVGAK